MVKGPVVIHCAYLKISCVEQHKYRQNVLVILSKKQPVALENKHSFVLMLSYVRSSLEVSFGRDVIYNRYLPPVPVPRQVSYTSWKDHFLDISNQYLGLQI